MLIVVSKLVRAPKIRVFEWCTNFQDDDAKYSRVRLRTRKVLERTPESILMEETGVMMLPFRARFEVKLNYPDWWEANANSNLGTTHNEYRLTEIPEGTRLDMRFNITLKGLMKPFSLIMKPYVRGKIEKEWNDYVRAMENEI